MKVIVYKCHDRHTDDEIKIYEYSKENLEKVKNMVKQDWDSPVNSHAAEVHYDGWDFEYGWGKRGKGTSVVIKDTTVDTGTITLNITNGYIVL